MVNGTEELVLSRISLYPNPAKTSAIMDLGALKGDFNLQIFEITGKFANNRKLSSSIEGSKLETTEMNFLLGSISID